MQNHKPRRRNRMHPGNDPNGAFITMRANIHWQGSVPWHSGHHASVPLARRLHLQLGLTEMSKGLWTMVDCDVRSMQPEAIYQRPAARRQSLSRTSGITEGAATAERAAQEVDEAAEEAAPLELQ